MAVRRNRKEKKSILAALLLFVCVALSTIVLMETMMEYLPSDKGAISLIGNVSATEGEESEPGVELEGNDSLLEQEENQNVQSDSDGKQEAGFVTSDDTVVWEKESEVEIFRVFYENESGEITVQSANGDSVIAPGTSNSYTFKLKNTGDVAIDYNVEMESFVTTSNEQIPIESRISRYDGKWLIGSADEYVDLDEFHAIDTGTVGAGNYIYYTLDWMWPFEGDDELDTLLGNLAVEEEFEFTIILRTEAVQSEDPDAEGGIQAPQMGDNYKAIVWIVLAGLAILVIFFLVFYKRQDEEDESQVEEETFEKGGKAKK